MSSTTGTPRGRGAGRWAPRPGGGSGSPAPSCRTGSTSIWATCRRPSCARNDLLARVRDADDAEALLRAFAVGADREADGGPGVLWSYRRDYGRVRLLMIDSRCGRVLKEGRRQMVGDAEFAWIEAQTDDRDYDHLLVGTQRPMAAAARPARYRGGRRTADRRSTGAPRSPGSRSTFGAPSTSSIGPHSTTRSSGSRVCSDGSGGTARTGPRRPLSACCPGTSTTPTSARPSTRTRRRRGSIS